MFSEILNDDDRIFFIFTKDEAEDILEGMTTELDKFSPEQRAVIEGFENALEESLSALDLTEVEFEPENAPEV